MTDLEIIISPEGIVRDGENKGQLARLDPEFYAASINRKSAAIETPGKAQKGLAVPEGKIAESPGLQAGKNTQAQKAETAVAKTALPGAQAQTKKPATAKEPDRLTLAELLPMTNIKTGKPQVIKPIQEQNAQKSEKALQQNRVEQAKKPDTEKKPQKEKQAKPAEPAKKTPAKTAKAKTGEEMRIPQEAIQTGNLDFLEGCWQGTRPEYYSKRTIRECFCFGASGKSGKRRIYDHGRMCIGGTRASLSKSGVLSVTSSGAACNDGEKWGSAEMVCRNSGSRTPCSWVFRDANNGQQSYTIPFIRVESCGR